jgi:hypothetical protein
MFFLGGKLTGMCVCVCMAQNTDGSMVVVTSGMLPPQFQMPGQIRFVLGVCVGVSMCVCVCVCVCVCACVCVCV